MHALLAQLAPVTRDPRANGERAARILREHPEVDLAVFPELYLSGYVQTGLEDVAGSPDGEELALVRAAARDMQTAVVIGFPERRPGGVANSLACFERDGTLAGVYRKTQLFGHERNVFVPGSELLIVRLAGVRVAPLVCFDVEFPELSREVARGGAELLVTASANMEPFYADHELATRARALENRLPLLYANLVGSVDGLRFVGGSRSVGAAGEVLAELGHAREEVLVAPVGRAGTEDERVDYLRWLPARLPVATP